MRSLLFLTVFIITTLPAATGAAPASPLETLVVRENRLPTPPSREMVAAIRDPFNWPAKQQKKFQAMSREKLDEIIARISLDGIIYSPEKPLALIGGKILTVNDTIEGYRIVEITPDRVTLRRGKVKKTMNLAMPSLRLDTKGKRP